MKVTNIYNLPQALVDAVSTERHNKDGEYSATTLLKGSCETLLTKRHWDDILVDASESIWQIFGTAVHAIFEKAGIEGFAEEKFEVPVSNSKVTGKVDLYDLQNEILYDWKTASIWKVKFADFSDWDKQGLIYAWLMKQNGLNVKEIKFVALLKDHSKSNARKDAEYPQKPIVVHTVKATEEALAEIETFIIEKVKQFEEAEKLADEKLTPCTEDERWATPEKWAIMKSGRKSALKLCDSEEEAKELLGKLGGTSIEHRAGENKKCDNYCNCREWCPLFKKEVTKC